jgi:cell division protein FtsI (penicillin-binding protein 3)
MVIIGIFIIGMAAHTMFFKRNYWLVVAERFVDSIPDKPNRGNILSDDGRLLASSSPEYRISVDFTTPGIYTRNRKEIGWTIDTTRISEKWKDPIFKRDTIAKHEALLNLKIDTISMGLHKIFPDKSVAHFKAHLKAGLKAKSKDYLIYPKRISYLQYLEVKKLPIFKMHLYKGGLKKEEFNSRKKPFGSLAARTLGDLYPDMSKGAKNGIELAFDSLLKGESGVAQRKKVKYQWINQPVTPPENGCDIVTTLNVDMQDLCEKALVDKLKEIDADMGVIILMEVKTGEIKAIVNMTKGKDGNYYEMRNNAISDMLEPGSTFKTASLMVAIEDGVISPETEVDTGNGVMEIEGRTMKDHNANRGGYGKINVMKILGYSSNVGVSYLIHKYYHNNPQKFVDGLKRMSLDQPLHLQIPGEGTPNIRGPKERKERGEYFSATSLPWMSIGYETQLPPINILTFYNAIANNGCMVRPMFVRKVMKDGKVVKEYPTEVINEQICSPKTLNQIRAMLQYVVTDGLAKQAGNPQFPVAGKTGTAQIWNSKGKTGGHLVSFCGYFPADDPKYCCIVSIQNPRIGYPSGGAMAGSVFGQIAQRIYALVTTSSLKAADSDAGIAPIVKSGNKQEALFVLDEVKVPDRQSLMASADREEETVDRDIVPDVIGMGAKDAVYFLEQCGLKVNLSGKGKVKRQSVPGGKRAIHGQTVTVELQ